MSKKNKKPAPTSSQSDLSFSLSKLYQKIITTKPSNAIVTITVIAFSIFLFSGGLFMITRENIMPSFYNPESGEWMFLYPDISDQFISDTVIAVIIYSIGFVGLITIYQSTKSAYKPRQAYMLLVVGITLVLLSYLFLEGSIISKSTSY